MSQTRRALVVIDVQNEYFDGGLLVEHPPRGESLRNITRAMEVARERSVPIVVVQHTAPSGSPVFARSSAAWSIHPEVAGHAHDLLVEKSAASALTDTPLRSWLHERAVDTITLVGYMTQNCVLSTALHGAHVGLAVEVLSDATGAIPYANTEGTLSAAELHRAVLVVLQSNFAAVLSTDAWIASLASGEPPPRDNIVLSNRRAVSAR